MNRTLYAFIDLALTAASYDCITALVRAMKVRDERGCDGLHIVFVPSENPKDFGPFRAWGKHDEAATVWRFWHICVASLPLAGATMTMSPTRALAKSMADDIWRDDPVWWEKGKIHFMGPLVEASRRGEKIPKLRATDAARRYVAQWIEAPFVTITMRQQDTDPDRNTSEDMHLFGEWLEEDQKIQVVYLDDTHQSLQIMGGGFAPLDPDLRLALYERARMNVIGNNGPQELLKFSDAPFLAFGQCPSAGWADHWRKYFSMEPGEQLPWSRADQRLVYLPDTFENLKAEFLKFAYTSQG